jgi:hypothetical protein
VWCRFVQPDKRQQWHTVARRTDLPVKIRSGTAAEVVPKKCVLLGRARVRGSGFFKPNPWLSWSFTGVTQGQSTLLSH